MPVQYSYAKFTDVVSAVSNRLYNPEQSQWTADEISQLVVESLRTWNALAQFQRAEFSFSLTQNNWWYDLRALTGTVIPYTVTQYDIISKIKRHLLEPSTPVTWGGSSQFTMGDVLSACRRRQDETLGETACTIVRSLVNAPLVNRCVLPDNTIDIRRVAWFPVTGNEYTNRILKQSDSFASRAFNAGYAQSGQKPPTKWMQNTETPPSFDVDTVPPVNGQYEVLTTQSGPDWVQSTSATLTIPDDWTWVFTFGAMADLFSRESLAKDELRAAYCRARYKEGLALMRLMPVALALRLNDVPMSLGAVTGGDKFNATWQAAVAGKPKSAYTFMNYLAFAPKPDSNTSYGAVVTVCQNMPVTEFYVQVPRDVIDTIIDYAQHLAMLKQGGQEFYESIALYQNLQRSAASYNGKLLEMGLFEPTQLGLSVREETSRNPRFAPSTAPQAVASN